MQRPLMTGESTIQIVCSRRGLAVRLNGRGIWGLVAAIDIFCPVLDGKRMLYSIQIAVLMAALWLCWTLVRHMNAPGQPS
jgi:hypothetical protein